MECKNEKFIPTLLETNYCINGNVKALVHDADDSQFINGDEDSCTKSDIPVLLKLIEDVYKKKLLNIEKNENLNENEKLKEKILTLQSYVQQLQEQIDTFASTMIELETEAQRRVNQMEKRLKSSAKTTMEAVINTHECEKEMRRLVKERLYIESLYKDLHQQLSSIKVENGFLRDQNFNLNHDVQALLHVIHHARSTGHWEMNCVTFCDVTPEQVFGPVQSISNLYSMESDSQIFSEADKKRETTLTSVPSYSTSLPKCVSLPEIGNIYSYTENTHKSNSYDTNSNNKTLGVKLSTFSKNGFRVNHGTPELLNDTALIDNLEQMFCTRKGQSEPHLFMFNDNIYKYRPCESLDKASISALNENYQSSLPPYQSIDLKFPTDDSSLRINAWNKLKTKSYLDAQENSFFKDNTSNSSCSCSESEIRGLKKQMDKSFKKRISSSIRPEKKISMQSLGLQTDTDTISQGTQVSSNDVVNLQQNISENIIEHFKDDLLKAKIKDEEKGILIEQLQNHLTSAVKEIELKDKVLENLEKKLQNSRDECLVLKNQVIDLNDEIQLVIKDLQDNRLLNSNLKIQMEQQSQIIRTLQEALVQSKRAFDAAYSKGPPFQVNSSENLHGKSQQTPKSSIVDI